MNRDEADLGRRGAQRPAPGRHVPSTPKVFGSRGQVWLVGVPAPPGRPCPCVQLIISGARRICWRVQPSTCLRLDGKRHQSRTQGDSMPGKVEKLPTAKRELSSTTCGPPRCPRRVGHGACEISALARLRNMILRVNAKAPRIRAWPGARESSERVPHIRSLCERSRILSLVEEPARHQAVERSAPLGLDLLGWKGRQSLLQPLPHNGHDALQAPLRPEGWTRDWKGH
jgi:hypothetical protein